MNIRISYIAVAVLATILVASLGFAQQGFQGDRFCYAPPPQQARVNVDLGNPPAAYGGAGGAAAPSSARTGSSTSSATTAPSTATAAPQAGAGQAQYNFPAQPQIIYVPMPQAPAPAPPVDPRPRDPLDIIGAVLLIAAVVTAAIALLVRNAKCDQNQGNQDGPALATSTAQLGMMEGAASALTFCASGAATYVTGTRPPGSAVMPGQGGGNGNGQQAAQPPAATPAQRQAALTALGVALGAGATATLAQQQNAISWVARNWSGYRGNAAARQTAINTDVATALALGNI